MCRPSLPPGASAMSKAASRNPDPRPSTPFEFFYSLVSPVSVLRIFSEQSTERNFSWRIERPTHRTANSSSESAAANLQHSARVSAACVARSSSMCEEQGTPPIPILQKRNRNPNKGQGSAPQIHKPSALLPVLFCFRVVVV